MYILTLPHVYAVLCSQCTVVSFLAQLHQLEQGRVCLVTPTVSLLKAPSAARTIPVVEDTQKDIQNRVAACARRTG